MAEKSRKKIDDRPKLDELFLFYPPHILGKAFDSLLVYASIIEQRIDYDELQREVGKFLDKHEIEPSPDVTKAIIRLLFAIYADVGKRKCQIVKVLNYSVEFLREAIYDLNRFIESPLFCHQFRLPFGGVDDYDKQIAQRLNNNESRNLLQDDLKKRIQPLENLKKQFQQELEKIEEIKRSGTLNNASAKFVGPALRHLSVILTLRGYKMSKYALAKLLDKVYGDLGVPVFGEKSEVPDFKTWIRRYT